MLSQTFKDINAAAHSALWGAPTLVLFLFCGIFFFIKLRLYSPRGMLAKGKRLSGGSGISPSAALWSSLAGTLGTGNIIGVTTALAIGGAGSILWMWLSALLGMATHYAEIFLCVKYRVRRESGFVGGPMYYIQNGVKSRFLAGVFCVFCALASFGTGNLAQSNAAATALFEGFGISPHISCVVIAVAAGIVMLGGVKRLGYVSERVVPTAAGLYALACVIVIICNARMLPQAVLSIFTSAFSASSAAGGVCGYAVSSAVRFGISRGIFGNEAGMGSSAIVHACADTDDPKAQGRLGAIEVFIDTIIMSSLTAFAVLCVPAANGSIHAVFSSVLGGVGSVLLSIVLPLLAFSSMIGWAHYGKSSVAFLLGPRASVVYCVLFAVCAAAGSLFDTQELFILSDSFNALMAIPNLAAVIVLSGEVKR